MVIRAQASSPRTDWPPNLTGGALKTPTEPAVTMTTTGAVTFCAMAIGRRGPRFRPPNINSSGRERDISP